MKSKILSSPWALPKPLFIQAPMEDVTDSVFRQMFLHTSPPDIFFTEFTNVEGVFSEGASKVIHRLVHTKNETPLIAQIWGHKPENYFNGAQYAKKHGFAGIDINMGCPKKEVIKKGLCSAMIDNHDQARKVIEATIAGASEGDNPIPVSVKTRIGLKKNTLSEWLPFLLSFDLAAITLHGRTAAEMSKVPAHWDVIAEAVKMRNAADSKILIIGNGDVKDRTDGLQKIAQTGVDGVMIGRGILENIFAFDVDPSKNERLTVSEKINLLLKHLELFEKTWTAPDAFHKKEYTLKKYYKIYIKSFDGASELRENLMNAKSLEETRDVLKAELANKNQG
ncbi:tRNA-dihydrouridine synthase [Candidatus Woesebacteria bacterium]|nr:tRNA-dihydrouridine synthase [Candidatus Woesebacteria bacterium]